MKKVIVGYIFDGYSETNLSVNFELSFKNLNTRFKKKKKSEKFYEQTDNSHFYIHIINLINYFTFNPYD